jgi:hypothetical protein
MRGSKTPAQVEAEFQAHYLYSGNASESAAAVGIPESTGRDIAKRLQGQAEFVEARRQLRTRALDELVAMRMRVARKAVERFEDEPSFAPGEIDKRPEFGRLVIEAEKSAQHLAKLETGERQSNEGGPVVINVYGPDGLEVAPDGDGSNPA